MGSKTHGEWFGSIVGLLITGFGLAALTGCGRETTTSTDLGEPAQQVGDLMAGVDEAGTTSGGYTLLDALSAERFFARRAPDELRTERLVQAFSLLPSAQAGVCSSSSSFTSCDGSGVKTRDLSGCTVGSKTFSGSVTLTFSNTSSCKLTNTGDHVTRVPNFTMTGRRGATLTVTKQGAVGQRVVKTGSGSYILSNDGIRRVFANGSTTLLDFTTSTTSNITVTGDSRAGRTMTGGAVQVLNNLTGVSCSFVPTAVTWSAGCNCPTSGSWASTCSDGTSQSISITGCGTATVTVGSESEAVTFDRCGTTS